MTRTIKNIFIYNENRIRFVKILAVLCILLVMFYGFSLYSLIENTVATQNVQKEISALNSDVQKLDTTYLELSSKVTPDSLKAFGLHQEKVSFFITRSNIPSVAYVSHEF